MDRLRPWLREHTWPYLVLAAVLAVLAWRMGLGGGETSGTAQPTATMDEAVTVAEPPERDVLVHVAGEVRRPGLYRLPPDVRVMRAIRQAGGATRRADVAALNLAAPVQDGQRIVVPRRGVPGTTQPAASSGSSTASGTTAGPISLSSATADDLQTLDGIGPKLAARIIEWRDAHGGFRSVEDLTDVPGIGDARMEALRPKLTP